MFSSSSLEKFNHHFIIYTFRTVYPTLEFTRRETLPHQAGDRSDNSEFSHNSKTTGLNNRDSELKLHATVQAVLPASRGSAEDSEQQQPELQLIIILIPASSGGTGLVTGEADPLDWNGKALLPQQGTVTTKSDASLQG